MRRSNVVSLTLDVFDHTPEPRQIIQETFVTISGRRVGLTPVFSAYWSFAAERQAIFFRRFAQRKGAPLTRDPILSRFKFTNAYRASDRVSQYLIRNVIYGPGLSQEPEEVFFRILLFKIFNKIETWELLKKEFEEISFGTFKFKQYDEVLSAHLTSGERIYSAAYIMPSCGSVFGHKYKHQNHLKLLRFMVEKEFPKRLSRTTAMGEAYELLRTAPSFGPFLAYQYVTDLNYSELLNFDESSFVVAGPGALDGIQKCFTDVGQVAPVDVIAFMQRNQHRYFSEMGLDFQTLWGRDLQLIDCQNVFCEISKYARVAFPEVKGVSGRTRIKQKFSAQADLPAPWYPPKWGINEKIRV